MDAGVVAYFKEIAGDEGYQTIVNEALKEGIRRKDIEKLLRRVIRGEMNSGEDLA